MKFALAALPILATTWLYPLAAELRGDACGALAPAAPPIETSTDPLPVSSPGVSLIPRAGDFIAAGTALSHCPTKIAISGSAGQCLKIMFCMAILLAR